MLQTLIELGVRRTQHQTNPQRPMLIEPATLCRAQLRKRGRLRLIGLCIRHVNHQEQSHAADKTGAQKTNDHCVALVCLHGSHVPFRLRTDKNRSTH
ncbi:Unknown protein sequence [Pseudomonas syringae pv. maculicola str. M6]|nr:Unknown protein sequence [Pseudomonas syringae pv. maculicola str. M6]